MFTSRGFAAVIVAATLVGCATTYPCVSRDARAKAATKQPRQGQIPEPPPAEDLGAHVHAAMSCSVDPCNDFYGYACGGYLAARQSGRNDRYMAAGFDQIRDRNRRIQHAILSVASSTKDETHEREVLGDFFDACMAEDTLAGSGIDVLASRFAAIEAITSTKDGIGVLADLQRIGVGAFFRLHVTSHPRDPRLGMLRLEQPATPLAIEHLRGLDERSDTYVAAYREYIRRLLEASGVRPATARTQSTAVLDLERELASKARTLTEIERGWEQEVATFEQLESRARGFPWQALAAAFEFPGNAPVMFDPRYVAQLESVFAAVDLATLKSYLRWRTLLPFARDGSKQSRSAARWFEDEVLREIPSSLVFAQWAHCVDRADTWLPELLAQYYVQLELPPTNRELVRNIAARVQTGFSERIARADWLDANARAGALGKLEGVQTRVGHPDRWRPYDAVNLDPANHLANIVRLAKLEGDVALYEVGRVRDAEAWPSSPVDPNAHYSAHTNTVTLNAGLLQWPLFFPDRPMVVNFAGIGAIAGHELGHAFDHGAIDRDATGRNRPWLVGESRSAYEERVRCVVRDLDQRRTTDGTRTIGDLARDEAIADLAGLQAAHAAWRAWQAEHPTDEPAIPGLTDDQLFFLTFAQAHCRNSTAAFERIAALTDEHANHRVRVNATLGHTRAFAEAFSCEATTPMHPARTCEVW